MVFLGLRVHLFALALDSRPQIRSPDTPLVLLVSLDGWESFRLSRKEVSPLQCGLDANLLDCRFQYLAKDGRFRCDGTGATGKLAAEAIFRPMGCLGLDGPVDGVGRTITAGLRIAPFVGSPPTAEPTAGITNRSLDRRRRLDRYRTFC